MYLTKFTQKDHYGISFINKVAGPHTSSIFNKTLKSDCCIKKRVGFICFNESFLKIMENAFSPKKYLFVLKIFNFFGHIGKRHDYKAKVRKLRLQS